MRPVAAFEIVSGNVGLAGAGDFDSANCDLPGNPACTNQDGELNEVWTRVQPIYTVIAGPNDPTAFSCPGAFSMLRQETNAAGTGPDFWACFGLGTNYHPVHNATDAFTAMTLDDQTQQVAVGSTSLTVRSRLRVHATDCTAITDGVSGQACYEQDSNRLFVCEPAAGGCDTAAEWVLVAAQAKSIEIPAAAMQVSGGCSSPIEESLIANGPRKYTITCTDNDADSIEFDFTFSANDNWNAGTIQVQLIAYSLTNQTGEVFAMDFAGRCIRDGDAIAAHSTTGEQAVSVTFGAQANDLRISAASNPITLQGTCAATSMITMRGQVNATSSTYAPFTDLRILGVKILYATN